MSNQEYTVNHAIDTLGFGYYQFLLSFIVGMAWVADAMEMMILRLRPFGFFPAFRHTVAQQISQWEIYMGQPQNKSTLFSSIWCIYNQPNL